MSQPIAEVGSYKLLSASGDVTTGACQLIGFYVANTNAGTLALTDGGSGGTALGGTITPAIGFHRYPATVGTNLYATIGGSSLSVTFFFASGN